MVLIEKLYVTMRPDDQKATLTEAKDFIRHINEKFDGAVDMEVKSMSMKELAHGLLPCVSFFH